MVSSPGNQSDPGRSGKVFVLFIPVAVVVVVTSCGARKYLVVLFTQVRASSDTKANLNTLMNNRY